MRLPSLVLRPAALSAAVLLTGGGNVAHTAPSPRMYQQRVVTGAIIVVLVLLIGLILWAKLFR